MSESFGFQNEIKEKQPVSWLEYFDEFQPDIVRQFIEKYSMVDIELNEVLNGIVSETIEMRDKAMGILKHFEKITGKSFAMDGSMSTSSSRDNLDVIKDRVYKMLVGIGKDGNKIIVWDTIFSNILPKLINNYLLNSLDTRELIKERLECYIGYLLDFSDDKSHGQDEYNKKYRTIKDRNIRLSYPRNLVDDPTGNLGEPNSIYRMLEEYRKGEKVDIVFCAPRSAVYSAQIFKSAMDYLAGKDKKFNLPYFALPTSKVFKAREALSGLSRDSILAYLADSDNPENYKRILREVGEREDVADNILEVVVNLKNACERVIGDKKEIAIGIYDESINQGRTRLTMSSIAETVGDHVRLKYGVEAKVVRMSPYEIDNTYAPKPSPFSSGRDDIGKLERYSESETPLQHSLAVLTNEITRFSGNHYGFVFHNAWGLYGKYLARRKQS